MVLCSALLSSEVFDGVNAMSVRVGAMVIKTRITHKTVIKSTESMLESVSRRGKRNDAMQPTRFGHQQFRRSYKLPGPMADTAPMQAHACQI